ncbi:YfgJ family double zinc ribbon protein [Chitinilyticum piscinae]|uniref:Zinc-ribbon domain-containing protein n=1 Tax=Chitinilyticum piscinae TaxID=2866724 RepID=A0A8J7FJH1_9NEIS|nr:zinc-ribbon domain-containing protein [Chitinilyticum piscinae]MBE9608667.1 zinc-ribbon domain-containing protein [Chitinilyticum piscinae]
MSDGLIPCPDCGKPLEVMKACGAIQYFCPHCNELKSGKRVRAAQAPQQDTPAAPDATPNQGG